MNSTKIAVRLSPRDQETLAAVSAAITTPHRPAPTVTEAIRAAISAAAAHLASSGLPR